MVTDVQRLMIFLAGGVAVFLVAMALGMRNVPFLIVATVLLGVAAATATVAARPGAPLPHETTTARVLSVSSPGRSVVAAPCRMKVTVSGHDGVPVTIRDSAVLVQHWPRVGQTLTVDLIGGDPRRLRVRWDLVGTGSHNAASHNAASHNAASHNAGSQHAGSQQAAAQHAGAEDAGAVARAPAPVVEVELFEEFTDLDGTVVTAGTGGTRRPPGGVGLADFDPAEVDRSDFGDDPPSSVGLDEVMPIIDVAPDIPVPRTRLTALADGVARGGTGIDVALPVADLSRTVSFYRDTLGLTVTFSSAGSAVVEADGMRLLLQRVDDPADRSPVVGAVQLEVADLDAARRVLGAYGVDIAPDDSPRRRSVRLHDPDGHEVELVQWRQD